MAEIPFDPRAFLFAEELNKRKLPVGSEDASKFANAVITENPPDGFLDRFSECFHYIDRQAFNKRMQWMIKTACKIVDIEPYYVAVTAKNKSN